MITQALIDSFLSCTRGQALREGTRYAREARVGDFIGSAASANAVVRGPGGDYEVALWAEGGALAHRCSCPSWRDPCKHQVAAAMVLRQCLPEVREGRKRGTQPTVAKLDAQRRRRIIGEPRVESVRGDAEAHSAQPGTSLPDLEAPEKSRTRALAERVAAARREKLPAKPDAPPWVRIGSASGFTYRVRLRGGSDGPHSCECPDFEANRLHTCKHVERVIALLGSSRLKLGAAHLRAARRPAIYLHFGEIVEPRLFGRPSGRGSRAVRAAFDANGLPLRPLARDEKEMHAWLEGFGSWVEPAALLWLARRAEQTPALPAGDFARLVPPLGLKPYPYQWAGATFLATAGRALLADEMGLGKTVQALLAAAALHEATPPARHVTVVCPASLRGGWQDEIRRWLGEEPVLLEGPTEARRRVIATRPRWLITHYEQVLRDHGHHAAHAPDLLIIDEAQRAKGLRTRTARVLKTIPSRYLFALTGTPLENRLEEAYAIAQLIDQRLLPPLWQIDREHFVRDPKGRRVVLYRNLDALRSRLAPAFLRRRKEDVALELPRRVRSTVMVPMHPAVTGTYDDVMAQVVRIANKKVILPADLERMMRLLVIARRCCNGPHMLGMDAAARDDRKVPKLSELEQALRDLCLGEGRKAVVFSEWTDMTERVEALCARLKLPAFHLRGNVPVRARPALIRSFTEAEGAAVFISTDAGGVGLNLQAAEVVINLDLPWNPARLEQRVARVHRIGSHRTVQEVLMICEDSIEHRILHLHATKRKVLDSIWARRGEDVIAAPGGSGAFREMVQALIETRAAGIPPVADLGRDAAEAAAAGDPLGPARNRAAQSGATTPTSMPAVITSAPVLGATPKGVENPVAAAGTPGVSTAAVDTHALTMAVAAVAPALPADHRKSLATVFRALAEALES